MLKELFYLHQFRSNAWKSEEELKKIQNKKLRAIIKHAYTNVKFYHDRFREKGLYPDDIKTTKDLKKLPIISKEDVIKKPDDFISKNIEIDNCIKKTSSGSTGTPFTIYFDKIGNAHDIAINYRALLENGLNFTDTILEITHPKNFPKKEEWFQKLGILRKFRASLFDSNEMVIKKITDSNPKIVIGYPSVFYFLAEYINKNKIKIKPFKRIFTSSEVLSIPKRKTIKETFGCDVIDLYGCVEFRRLAWECYRHEGYHMDVDYAAIEIVIDNETVENESGSIVVTSLHNYAMPLLRYKNGDLAKSSKHKCTCGRGLPLLEVIIGRSDDVIILPSGKKISPLRLYLAKTIEGVKYYRVIQEKRHLIIVQVVKNSLFSETSLKKIQNQLKIACLNEDVEIKVKFVDEIPRENTGKLRTVISKVKK